jgi:hypothetical protein
MFRNNFNVITAVTVNTFAHLLVSKHKIIFQIEHEGNQEGWGYKTDEIGREGKIQKYL